ncbi:MAG: hypothetical protein ACYC46_08890 [Acidobacteriaceae bacterium]
MAVQVNTHDAHGLLDAIYDAIEDATLDAWSADEDGNFSYDGEGGRWSGRALLCPTVEMGYLQLNIVGDAVSEEAYAVCHARFIEMLLMNFVGQFTSAAATAEAVEGDEID